MKKAKTRWQKLSRKAKVLILILVFLFVGTASVFALDLPSLETRGDLAYWINNLFYQYGFDESFAWWSTETTIIPRNYFGLGICWSWDKPYGNPYSYGPDANGLYWSPLEYALLNLDAPKAVFIIENCFVGKECNNVTGNGCPEEQWPRIYGYKWHDKNANKERDQGEPPLAGWRISLLDSNKNPVLDRNNQPMVQYTGADGRYMFDLNYIKRGVYSFPTTFYVVEEDLSGWHHTTPSEVAVYIGTGPEWANRNIGPFDFGNFKEGKKSGYKWEDMNKDGIWQKATEPALKNWKIILTKPDGSTSYKYTDKDGYYEFTGLRYGWHSVKEELQEGWVQTFPPPPGIH